MNKILTFIICMVLCITASTALPEQERPAAKMRLAIMDFETVDTEANRYLKHNDKFSVDSGKALLSAEDKALLSEEERREAVKIETNEKLQARQAERNRVAAENQEEKARKAAQRRATLSSKTGRSVIVGADMLAAELSKYTDLFEIIDRRRLEESLTELELQKSGLTGGESSKQIGQMTGATHQVYGTVEDFRMEERKFSGYGVRSNNIVYGLDLIIKVVEVGSSKVVFSDRVSHEFSEIKTQMSKASDTGMEKKLLQGAIKKASDSIYKQFKGPAVTQAAVSIPKVLVAPRGADGKEVAADVEIDGEWSGNTPAEIEVRSGKHQVTLSAKGYEPWTKTIDIRSGMKISPELTEKK